MLYFPFYSQYQCGARLAFVRFSPEVPSVWLFSVLLPVSPTNFGKFISCCLFLSSVFCYGLLFPISLFVSLCILLPLSVSCCTPMSPFTSYPLLLSLTICCCLLVSPFVSCCPLFSATVCCCLLLPPPVSFGLMLFPSVSWLSPTVSSCLLLSPVFSYYISPVVSNCLLLSPTVSCCFLNLFCLLVYLIIS